MRKIFYILLPFFIFSCSYNSEIQDYELSENVLLENMGSYYLIMPQCYEMDEAVLFYPGGLVSPDAYIPLGAELAEELNLAVIIEKMPLNLAILGQKRADKRLEEYSYIKQWFFAGHSLGGVMAASWIYDNPGIFNALILLASYPMDKKSLSERGIAVHSIRGSEDNLVSEDKIIETLEYLPEKRRIQNISGGNHAQFGMYGEQKDDGKASISPEEQRAVTVKMIGKFLEDFNLRKVY